MEIKTKIYFLLGLRIFLSTIFIFSAVGKIIDPTSTVLILKQLFNLPNQILSILVYIISIFELGLIIIVWQQNIPKLLIAIPISFIIVLIFSQLKGINCDCFGSLPIFGQLPFFIHLLLIIIIFIFILLVNDSNKNWRHSKTSVFYLSNLIIIIVAILLFTFFSLDSRVNNTRFVTKQELKSALKNKTSIIIDSRLTSQYEIGHIGNALNIPYHVNTSELLNFIKVHSLKDKSIIVYC